MSKFARMQRQYPTCCRRLCFRYNKLSRNVRDLAKKIRDLDDKDGFRAQCTHRLLEKLCELQLILSFPHLPPLLTNTSNNSVVLLYFPTSGTVLVSSQPNRICLSQRKSQPLHSAGGSRHLPLFIHSMTCATCLQGWEVTKYKYFVPVLE